MSEGGPGLPSMGVMKTNWFTVRHEKYNASMIALDHTHTLGPGSALDPYYTYEYWAIPVTWQSNLFFSEYWDLRVRRIGTDATKMGPLTLGTRRFAGHHDEARSFQPISNPEIYQEGFFAPYPIHHAMSAEVKARHVSENERIGQVARILEKRRNTQGQQYHMYNPELLKNDLIDRIDQDSDTEDEQGVDEVVPSCPRWSEITEYLFDNRGPLELALDSMTFDMPEATLYRYIMDRGGLKITPQEFRVFLRHCDHSNDLFK